jgi:hypothetical protein
MVLKYPFVDNAFTKRHEIACNNLIDPYKWVKFTPECYLDVELNYEAGDWIDYRPWNDDNISTIVDFSIQDPRADVIAGDLLVPPRKCRISDTLVIQHDGNTRRAQRPEPIRRIDKNSSFRPLQQWIHKKYTPNTYLIGGSDRCQYVVGRMVDSLSRSMRLSDKDGAHINMRRNKTLYTLLQGAAWKNSSVRLALPQNGPVSYFRPERLDLRWEGKRDEVTCDVCKMCPIVGIRYVKTAPSGEMDLCGDCYVFSGEDQSQYSLLGKAEFDAWRKIH